MNTHYHCIVVIICKKNCTICIERFEIMHILCRLGFFKTTSLVVWCACTQVKQACSKMPCFYIFVKTVCEKGLKGAYIKRTPKLLLCNFRRSTAASLQRPRFLSLLL